MLCSSGCDHEPSLVIGSLLTEDRLWSVWDRSEGSNV